MPTSRRILQRSVLTALTLITVSACQQNQLPNDISSAEVTASASPALATASPTPSADVQAPASTDPATPDAETASFVSLEVTLDSLNLTTEQKEKLAEGPVTLSITADELDGPMPEPMAAATDEELAAIVPQRAPQPIFSFTQTAMANDTFRFENIPAGKSFTLSMESVLWRTEPVCFRGDTRYMLVASKAIDALSASTQTQLRIETAVYQDNDISVVEGSASHGLITDSEGNPIEGVTVSAEAVQAVTDKCFAGIHNTQSNPSGVFRFGYPDNRLMAGIIYRFTFQKEGYVTQTQELILRSNKAGDPTLNQLDITLEKDAN